MATKYKENPLRAISTTFDTESQKDRETLNSLFAMVVEDKMEEMRVKHLFQSAQELTELIQIRANGIQQCSIKFSRGDEGLDSASMLIGIQKKPYYFNNEIFGYFSKKNTIDFHLKIAKIEIEKLKDLEKYSKAQRIGTQFKFDKWAS